MTNPMTNTPSPDEDRELIEPLCDHCGKPEYKHVQIVGAGKVCQASCFTFSTAKTARIESLLSDRAKLEERVRECEDGLDRIADVWTLQARTLPTDRKWHCQHEEWLSAAVEQARASLSRSTDRAT